jgi:hypothetical protein
MDARMRLIVMLLVHCLSFSFLSLFFCRRRSSVLINVKQNRYSSVQQNLSSADAPKRFRKIKESAILKQILLHNMTFPDKAAT